MEMIQQSTAWGGVGWGRGSDTAMSHAPQTLAQVAEGWRRQDAERSAGLRRLQATAEASALALNAETQVAAGPGHVEGVESGEGKCLGVGQQALPPP